MKRAISVIIPAYNAAATIGRAIASALAEPEVGAVIVVDDGSTDETEAAALAADDGSGRLRIHALPQNGGPSAARNAALALAELPLVALLDSDDYLLPGRFARMLAVGGEDWDFLADDMLFTRTEGALPEDVVAAAIGEAAQRRALDLGAFVAGNISHPLRQRAELGFVKPLFRRETFERLGLGYDLSLRLGEDYVLYCQALIRGARFVLVSTCGYVAVERARSLSGLHRTRDLEALQQADRALVAEARARGASRREIGLLRRHCTTIGTKVDIRRAIDQAHERGRARVLMALATTPLRLGRIAIGVLTDRLAGARATRDSGVRRLLVEGSFP